MNSLVASETVASKPLPLSLRIAKDAKLPEFSISAWDLQEISKDNVTEHCFHRIDPDACHLMGFWSYFEWWNDLASGLAGDLSEDIQRSDRLFSVDSLEYEKELREVVARTVDKWPDALLSGISFSQYAIQPKLELFKRYYALTRFVCATAQKMYPGHDLNWLTNHA